ncbi:hypothetical protein Dimus_007465, partial [Dionaea muscipula]
LELLLAAHSLSCCRCSLDAAGLAAWEMKASWLQHVAWLNCMATHLLAYFIGAGSCPTPLLVNYISRCMESPFSSLIVARHVCIDRMKETSCSFARRCSPGSAHLHRSTMSHCPQSPLLANEPPCPPPPLLAKVELAKEGDEAASAGALPPAARRKPPPTARPGQLPLLAAGAAARIKELLFAPSPYNGCSQP